MKPVKFEENVRVKKRAKNTALQLPLELIRNFIRLK